MIENEYIPGVCNIGKEEINRRKRIGIYWFAFTILIFILFLFYDTPKYLRVIIFIPVFISAMGFLQARMHFCARLGLTSFFNFGTVGKKNIVTDNEFIKQDRMQALKIIFYSFMIGVICAAITVII